MGDEDQLFHLQPPHPTNSRQSGDRYLLRTSAEDRREKRSPQRDMAKGFPRPSSPCNPRQVPSPEQSFEGTGQRGQIPRCLSFPQRILQTLQTSIHSYRSEVVYEHLSFHLPTQMSHLLRNQRNTITTCDCWCLQPNVRIRKSMEDSTHDLLFPRISAKKVLH